MREFFKKKMNVVRFSTVEPTKVSVEDLIEGLTMYGFKDITNLDVNCGFVTFEHPYSENPVFDPEKHVFGNYFAGLFRIDKRSVPSSALKKEVSEAVSRELDVSGKQYISRGEKRRIADEIKARFLAKAAPNIYFIPFVVDMTTGNGFFYNTSKNNFELFEELFERASGNMIYIDHICLYNDFLTYIWWDSESNSFTDMTYNGILVKTWVGNKINVESEEQKLSASGENIEEAKLAISKGADVTKLELWLRFETSRGPISVGGGERINLPRFEEIKFSVTWKDGQISSLTYDEDLLPDDESPYLVPFIERTKAAFEVIDLWERRYIEANENDKGLTPKIRETWGRGNYCSKAFENV